MAAAVVFALGVVDVVTKGAHAAGVVIREAPGKGLGAFTTRERRLGEVLGRYEGEVLTERERDARYLGGELLPSDEAWLESRRARGVGITGDYVLALGPDCFVDAEDPVHASWTRYLNHDANANVGLFREKDEKGQEYPCFIVIRTCREGDELCFDYGPDYWRFCDVPPVESETLMWANDDDDDLLLTLDEEAQGQGPHRPEGDASSES